MTSPLETAVLVGATVCTGLTSGLLYVFAHTVMPGLAAMDDRAMLTSFWRIDSAITNAWMGLAWLGSPVLVVAALLLHLPARDGALAFLALAAVLVLATQAITGIVHLPLNAAVQDAAPAFADAAALRDRFEPAWVRWNVVRAATSVAATASCCVALSLAAGLPEPPRPTHTTPHWRTDMFITVFGATSTTGRPLVEQALARGHHVTAHTRDASRIATTHPALRVVTGDVTDPAQCGEALDGADAVVVTLGAGRRGVVREAGTRAVTEAMTATGARRLVVQSTLGTGSSRAHLTFWWRRVMFGALLREAYADHVRQEAVVKASGLDWTIVRPAAFTDEPQPDVRHGFGPEATGLRLKVGRTDVASFLLDVATDGSFVGRSVSLSA